MFVGLWLAEWKWKPCPLLINIYSINSIIGALLAIYTVWSINVSLRIGVGYTFGGSWSGGVRCVRCVWWSEVCLVE